MTEDAGSAVLAVVALRLRRERSARGWSCRELAARARVSPATVSRAERGTGDLWMTCAARLAGALGILLSDFVAPQQCAVCDGAPPQGFTCNSCGRASDGD